MQAGVVVDSLGSQLFMLRLVCFCRRALQNKRNMLEVLQKRCTAAQSKLEGEYSHLGSLEAKTKELENLRKVLCLAVMCSTTLCCALLLATAVPSWLAGLLSAKLQSDVLSRSLLISACEECMLPSLTNVQHACRLLTTCCSQLLMQVLC